MYKKNPVPIKPLFFNLDITTTEFIRNEKLKSVILEVSFDMYIYNPTTFPETIVTSAHVPSEESE